MAGIANAKTILFGEHAVVYGEPGIAIPLSGLSTEARFEMTGASNSFRIVSEEFGLDAVFESLDAEDPIRQLILRMMDESNITDLSGMQLTLRSNIPIAAGLGSGAACSIAIIRAFAEKFQLELAVEKVSSLAFEIEKIHHGSPSGLDNTVIACNQPVYFMREKGFEILPLAQPLNLIVASTGLKSSTREVIQYVRENYPRCQNALRDIGAISRQAKDAILRADLVQIGSMMSDNHALLREIGVSCEALDRLVATALGAGALGAKMTGAGRGGNMIALVTDEQTRKNVSETLKEEGGEIIL